MQAISNCSEYRPNNYKYTAILYSYLYSRKPVCRTGRRARAKLSHSPSFIDKFIDYGSWVINLLLDGLVCSIASYFYSLFVFRLSTGSLKYGTPYKNIQRYYTPKHLIRYNAAYCNWSVPDTTLRSC